MPDSGPKRAVAGWQRLRRHRPSGCVGPDRQFPVTVTSRHHMTSFRCAFSAWIAAWFVAVFLPSAMLAYLGVSDAAATIGTGFDRLLATTWKVADDVGPTVKLLLGALLLVGLHAAVSVFRSRSVLAYAASAAVGAMAAIITVAIIPEALSRGFAGALTGERFHPMTTFAYALGGLVAGLAHRFVLVRCDAHALPT